MDTGLHTFCERTQLTLAIALAIGVLFGVYPASRAASMAPIDALRNE